MIIVGAILIVVGIITVVLSLSDLFENGIWIGLLCLFFGILFIIIDTNSPSEIVLDRVVITDRIELDYQIIIFDEPMEVSFYNTMALRPLTMWNTHYDFKIEIKEVE